MSPLTGLAFIISATSFPGEVAASAVPQAELAIGYKIRGRDLEAIEPDNVFLEGDNVVAWSAVSGIQAGFIEHIWFRDGAEIARHYLPVGAGRRWRTWTRHQVEAGQYNIQVRDPGGKLLREVRFEVEGWEVGDESDAGC